jgi:hypothetical protein
LRSRPLAAAVYVEILSFRALRQRIRRCCKKENLTFKEFLRTHPRISRTYNWTSWRYNVFRNTSSVDSVVKTDLQDDEEPSLKEVSLSKEIKDLKLKVASLEKRLLVQASETGNQSAKYGNLLEKSKIIQEKAIRFRTERDNSRADLLVSNKTADRIIKRFTEYLKIMHAQPAVISKMKEGLSKIAEHERSRNHKNPVVDD